MKSESDEISFVIYLGGVLVGSLLLITEFAGIGGLLVIFSLSLVVTGFSSKVHASPLSALSESELKSAEEQGYILPTVVSDRATPQASHGHFQRRTIDDNVYVGGLAADSRKTEILGYLDIAERRRKGHEINHCSRNRFLWN